GAVCQRKNLRGVHAFYVILTTVNMGSTVRIDACRYSQKVKRNVIPTSCTDVIFGPLVSRLDSSCDGGRVAYRQDGACSGAIFECPGDWRYFRADCVGAVGYDVSTPGQGAL